ncbi:MAG: transporter substrate-binding domain-containing protein [Acidiferrobacterales bacterium]
MTSSLFRAAIAAIFAAAAVVAAAPAVADAVDDIKKRGKLIVGTKADYKPYGFRDPSGKIVGLEPDLAKELADNLGVKLELVPVVASNRMQFLQQGKIDMMIATMTDRPDRRKVVWILDPNYYSSGTNILAPKKAGFEKWEDLRGKPVCGIQGAFYNKKTSKEFGAKIVAFKATPEVYTALKQGRCMGFVYDDSSILGTLQDEAQWGDYEMPLETIDDAPWGLAVRHGEHRLYGIVSEMIQKWHGSGRILELETKWSVKNTPFAKRMHTKYK